MKGDGVGLKGEGEQRTTTISSPDEDVHRSSNKDRCDGPAILGYGWTRREWRWGLGRERMEGGRVG